jgi:hypothetical protein
MPKETIDGELVTVARFGRHLAMVRVASGKALVPSLASTAVVQARAPPPSNKLAREAPTRWHNGGRFVGNGD